MRLTIAKRKISRRAPLVIRRAATKNPPEAGRCRVAALLTGKRPHVIETLPDMIPLSRGEHFAVMHGLRRQLPELPVAPDLLGLVEVVYGPLMAKTLRMIAYPLARHMAASQ